MNTFRTCAIVVLATVALAVSVPSLLAADKSKTSDLLTTKQVKALVANARTPADHIRLSKHFEALAATYEAEATGHADNGAAYRKNPIGMAGRPANAEVTIAHCDRLAELSRESAKEARELASAHAQMAAAPKE